MQKNVRVGENEIVIKQLYLFVLYPLENVQVCVQLQWDTGWGEIILIYIETFVLNRNYFFKK